MGRWCTASAPLRTSAEIEQVPGLRMSPAEMFVHGVEPRAGFIEAPRSDLAFRVPPARSASFRSGCPNQWGGLQRGLVSIAIPRQIRRPPASESGTSISTRRHHPRLLHATQRMENGTRCDGRRHPTLTSHFRRRLHVLRTGAIAQGRSDDPEIPFSRASRTLEDRACDSPLDQRIALMSRRASCADQGPRHRRGSPQPG